jgi:DNA helicase-2/ATP-dependent DNA helicase PcrA
MQLNEEQMAAVEHPLGVPACLIAGAGSGKTRVLTERVKWLIAQGVPPRRICAITFTNKAAGELVERLELEEDSFEIPKVSTIHSLALSAIRKSPLGFGLQEKVTPLDDYDQHQMLRRIIERTVDVKEKGISLSSYVYGFLEKVGFHRSRGLGFSSEYTDEIHEKALVEHAGYHALEPFDMQIWKLYEEEKKKNSVVDFDDMLHLVVRRLRADEPYRTALQRQFDVVLMDEAQDTNPVQWEFINFLLAPDKQDMYVVGDMSQCIYAFNGAVPKILKDYSEGWRNTIPTLHKIARNHRSLPRIVYLANHIQSKMTATIPLKMQVFRGDADNKGLIELTQASLPSDIGMLIAAEISKDSQRKNGNIAFKDNAILVRSARQVNDIENALVRYRIPYVVRGGRGLLQTEEVRDVISYLRLITNPKDFTALARAVSVPKRGVGDVALEKIRRVAQESYNGDLLQASASVEKLNLFSLSLQNIQRYLEYPTQALDQIIAFMDYKKYIDNKYKKEPDKVKSKLENLERFKELVRGTLLRALCLTSSAWALKMKSRKSGGCSTLLAPEPKTSCLSASRPWARMERIRSV